jgi:hypothetical protein
MSYLKTNKGKLSITKRTQKFPYFLAGLPPSPQFKPQGLHLIFVEEMVFNFHLRRYEG